MILKPCLIKGKGKREKGSLNQKYCGEEKLQKGFLEIVSI
jgi:hypothetical protein